MHPMTRAHELLERGSGLDRQTYQIKWSNTYLNTFQAILDGHAAPRTPVDIELAPVFLQYARGELASADEELSRIGLAFTAQGSPSQETFISLLYAFYVAQRFDVVAALLADRYEFTAPLEIGAIPNGPGASRVSWTIDDAGLHRFEFDAQSFTTDNTRNDILCFQWTFPLYAFYAESEFPETGTVVINQGDRGATPGLSYCDSRPDYFLIPDYIFIPSRGYAYHRNLAIDKRVSWAEKKPVAMWRGATTGMRAAPGDWRSLERVRMCDKVQKSSEADLFDVGLSSIIQFSNQTTVKEIQDSGLLRNFIPSEQWNKYKYLIDIDGNSSPWSNLFQKLLSGSAVLKIESSRGLQQWYYDSLKPWKNYVPIAPDFSDLVEKTKWLIQNDSTAASIGRAGQELAHRLSYERELERSVPVISAAFRYFSGDFSDTAPFGRVAASGSLRDD